MTACRLCERLREILHEAPWSSYDLIVSSIVFWLGVYLLMSPGLFGEFSGVYKMLSRLGDEFVWGWSFLACGVSGLLNVLWITRLCLWITTSTGWARSASTATR